MKNVRRKWRERDLGKIVPVKTKKDSIGFDGEVNKQLNLLREESVEFRKVSEQKGEKDSEVSRRFGLIFERMTKLVEREGCYYPDSIRKEVVSVAIRSGGPVFSNLFVSNNTSESLKKMQSIHTHTHFVNAKCFA